jgi:hypothetical protein
MRSWRWWPVDSCGSTTIARTGSVVGQRIDASTVATPTTSSPVAPRRASLMLEHTTTVVDARASGSTPRQAQVQGRI